VYSKVIHKQHPQIYATKPLECIDSSRQMHQVVLYDFNATERKPANVRIKTDKSTGLVVFEGEE
jgi:hypothetical protein